MIKILKNKFLISMFLLVVTVIITSSCYAMTVESADNLPFSVDNIYSNSQLITYFQNNCGYTPTADNTTLLVYYSNNKYYAIVIDGINHNYIYNGSGYKYYYGYLKSATGASANRAVLHGSSSLSYYVGGNTTTFGEYLFASGSKVYDCSTIAVYNDNGNTLIYEPAPKMSVDVTHEFQSDTSAKINFAINNAPEDAVLKYSLSGVKLNVDLLAPFELENPVTYSPGVTNLVVKPKTKVYWALYDSLGKCLLSNVYQVPEYDAVIENSDKSIEYTVTYNSDNSKATLTVNVVNGEFSDKLYYTENGMISNNFAGKQLFPASRSLEIDHNCNMHVILYDPFDNIITAKYITINKIGSIPEQNFKVDVTKGDKTVYVRPRLYNVLQSRFYDIEYDVILDTFTSSKDIELHQDGVYVGKVTDTSQTHVCGSDSELKFYQNIGTSNITVTFRILNAETREVCITRTVSFKIGLDNESTGVTGSTTNGNADDSFITSEGSSNNTGGYSNVTWKDITGMINTNSDFWQIVKNIFSCLPTWITAPLFFFISAIVTICLTKLVLSIVGNLVG